MQVMLDCIFRAAPQALLATALAALKSSDRQLYAGGLQYLSEQLLVPPRAPQRPAVADDSSGARSGWR